MSIRQSFRPLAAAASLTLLAGLTTAGTASAMPLGGLAAASDAAPSNVQDVRWVCGPRRCWWRPGPAPYYGYYAPRRFYGYYGPRYRYGWHGGRRHYWR